MKYQQRHLAFFAAAFILFPAVMAVETKLDDGKTVYVEKTTSQKQSLWSRFLARFKKKKQVTEEATLKPEPDPDYKPGCHSNTLPQASDKSYYENWETLKNGSSFQNSALPERLKASVKAKSEISFSLYENGTTGFLWFARFHSGDCKVAIDHLGPAKQEKNTMEICGAGGSAAITIKPLRSCETLVELVYARSWEWEKDMDPAHVIQIFISVEP